MKDKRILIIAQTPPPFHGQAIIQKYLVDVNWDWCKKDFVRMNFSNEISEVGVFGIKKVLQLFQLIAEIRRNTKTKPDLVYYPPAGPNRIPVYRDILILYFLNRVSRKIILHFHAGGIDQIFKKVTKLESFFIKKAFSKAEAVIVLSDWLKKEVVWCKANKTFVVNNGIEDVFGRYLHKIVLPEVVSFLFIGNLKKEKGIFTLLKAARILHKRGQRFDIKFIGAFHSNEEKDAFMRFVEENDLKHHVRYLGTKSGDEKWSEFANSNVVCLPTFETEAMPVSILEAMMFQLPVITTNWRSIPDLIKHDENGLLFEPDNADQLADCMQKLIESDNKRVEMGLQGRRDFIQKYTVEQHLKKMEIVFREALVSQ